MHYFIQIKQIVIFPENPRRGDGADSRQGALCSVAGAHAIARREQANDRLQAIGYNRSA
jgi:hypothetical protein